MAGKAQGSVIEGTLKGEGDVPLELSVHLRAAAMAATPKIIWWGPDRLCFYNDPYLTLIPSLSRGNRGKRSGDVMPLTLSTFERYVDDAMNGKGSIVEDVHVRSMGARSQGDAYLTLAFSPLPDLKGQIGGVLCDIHQSCSADRIQEMIDLASKKILDPFENAPILIAYISVPSYRFEFVNKAFCNLFGHRRLYGRRIFDALPELGRQDLQAILEGIVETAAPWEGREVLLTIANPGCDPQEQFLDVTLQPLLDRRDGVTAIVFGGSVATERKHAQDRAERLQRMMLHGSRLNAMGTMAMTLAHELNQPLAAASTFLGSADRYLGSSEPSVETARQALARAQAQVQRAGDIIKRSRNFLERGGPALGRVSLPAAIGSAVALLKASDGADTLDVIVRRPGDELAWVRADAIQLEQIMVNLLRNAMQASRGMPRQTVEVAVSRQGDQVQVSVRDWGRGLPEEGAASLFSTFQTSRPDGMGIGLAITRTIVEAHGGRIWAEDNPEGGAIFSFTLPRVAD